MCYKKLASNVYGEYSESTSFLMSDTVFGYIHDTNINVETYVDAKLDLNDNYVLTFVSVVQNSVDDENNDKTYALTSTYEIWINKSMNL